MIQPDDEKFNTKTNKNIIKDMSFDEMFGDVRKIYSHGCKQMDGTIDDCFGDLNQKGRLVTLFDDPDFRYYHKTMKVDQQAITDSIGNKSSSRLSLLNTWGSFIHHRYEINHQAELKNKTFPVYGQPILRIGGKYAVYLKSSISAIPDLRYHYFYNLRATKYKEVLFKLSDEDIESYLFNKNSDSYKKNQETKRIREITSVFSSGTHISQYKYSNGMIGTLNSKRFNWEAVDINKVHYIGLTSDPIKGTKYNLTGYGSNNGNYFNPFNEGSNYGVSEEVAELINQEDEVNISGFCNYTRAQLMHFKLLSFGTSLPQGCTLTNCLDC
jgi:hypothetical protein